MSTQSDMRVLLTRRRTESAHLQLAPAQNAERSVREFGRTRGRRGTELLEQAQSAGGLPARSHLLKVRQRRLELATRAIKASSNRRNVLSPPG